MITWKRFCLITALFFLLIPFTEAVAQSKEMTVISVNEDWLIVDGERFFVKAIGYSPLRPLEDPSQRKFYKKRSKQDFSAIKNTGFNTLRTWGPLLPEEILLAKKTGLFLIPGMDVSHIDRKDDKKAIQTIVDLLKKEEEKVTVKDVILYYLLEKVPYVEEGFTSKLKKALDKNLPGVLVCVSSETEWGAADLLPWKVKSVHMYPFYPATIRFALGYYGFAGWTKEAWSDGSPLIVTDLSISLSGGSKNNFKRKIWNKTIRATE